MCSKIYLDIYVNTKVRKLFKHATEDSYFLDIIITFYTHSMFCVTVYVTIVFMPISIMSYLSLLHECLDHRRFTIYVRDAYMHTIQFLARWQVKHVCRRDLYNVHISRTLDVPIYFVTNVLAKYKLLLLD